jgi:hypothetical protein
MGHLKIQAPVVLGGCNLSGICSLDEGDIGNTVEAAADTEWRVSYTKGWIFRS